MRKAILLGIAAGALGLGLVATSAPAAPMGGVALQTDAASAVEQVRHRCYPSAYGWRCRPHRRSSFFWGPRLWFGFGPFAFGVHRPYYRHHYYRPYPAYYRYRRGCCW
jgi:hypothetical protein